MEEVNKDRKNNKTNIIIFFILIILIIFLIIFYIKNTSNKIENFKEENKINTQSLLLDQIKKNKEKLNNNLNEEENNVLFLNKDFFEDIKQSTIVNDIKNNIDAMQIYFKKYKEEDLKNIKENLNKILNILEDKKNDSKEILSTEENIEEKKSDNNEFEKIDI